MIDVEQELAELATRGINHPKTVERIRAARAAGLDVPATILVMHPEVDPLTWERLSAVRYRAQHPRAGFVVLSVSLFGETHSSGCRADAVTERDRFAGLIASTTLGAAHRVACQEGTPIVRPNTAANEGVVGCCWWCGKLPEQHVEADAEAPE